MKNENKQGRIRDSGMKRLFNKIINIFKNFFLWLWKECRDWRTFVLLVIVCLAIGIPVWGGYLLFILFGWKWAFVVASACLAFWWIPGVPFFTVSVMVTLALKRLFFAICKRKQKKTEEEKSISPLKPEDIEPNPPHDAES